MYRDTNIEGIDNSPAQLFLGRRLKTTLPITKPLLQKTTTNNIVKKKKLFLQKKKKSQFDKCCSKEQVNLQDGQQIIMKRKENSKCEPATVVQKNESPRSYIARTKNNGELYRRNRTHIRPAKACLTPHEDDREDVLYLLRRITTNQKITTNLQLIFHYLYQQQRKQPPVPVET
ncbi:hypothetical protein DPMN_141891 [Dreissena polymorpha]|uniref:Uncharacterized protein n=1 Tax=Dreissena polymorpha TaxID=45954 RepID=A0A9D4GD75_DREPO|nr:hypothetical protein DPMN_141891 [Dreissena polymorpha]